MRFFDQQSKSGITFFEKLRNLGEGNDPKAELLTSCLMRKTPTVDFIISPKLEKIFQSKFTMKLDIVNSLAAREINPSCSSSAGKLAKFLNSSISSKIQSRILAAEWCNSDCQNSQLQCIVDCANDTACVSTCNRDFLTCQSDCPCYDNCYDGCPCESETQYCR